MDKERNIIRMPLAIHLSPAIFFFAWLIFLFSSFIAVIQIFNYGWIGLIVGIPAMILIFSLAININLWYKIVYFLHRWWIMRKMRCSVCQEKFEKCTENFKNLGKDRQLPFLIYCERCKEVFAIKKNGREIKIANTNNYFYKNFKAVLSKSQLTIPGRIIFFDHVLEIIFNPIIIFVIFFLIAVLAYVANFGANKSSGHWIRENKMFLLYFSMGIIPMIFYKNRFLVNARCYNLRRWIIKKIKCPYCGANFADCRVKMNTIFYFNPDNYSIAAKCENCGKISTFKKEPFLNLLLNRNHKSYEDLRTAKNNID